MMRTRNIYALLPVLLLAACGGATAASSGGVAEASTTPDAGYDGPDVSFDATPPPQCILEQSTTLPHVHVVFHAPECVFTLAQAAAGITFAYDLVVDQDVPGFVPASPYWYGSNAANLVLSESISGGGQSYCVCDQGLPYPECPVDDGGVAPPDGGPGQGSCGPVTIPAGVYHRTFAWDGRNWSGPSDTGNPEGAPFPPGDYELDVTTAPGSIAGVGSGLAAKGRFLVRLTP